MSDSDSSASLDAAAISHLQQWVGRTESLSDDLTSAPLRALAATLDRDDAPAARGTHLPELWHWLFFLPHHRQSVIGPDGHPQRGGFLPPVPLPRRMWAGGRLQWHQPVLVGETLERRSQIVSVNHKSGRSGEMVFVLVRHEIHGPHGLAITEEQDIVYRAAAQPGETPPAPTAAATDGQWQRAVVPDEVLLFRYSALTFNGHRIHYDRRYVQDVEGYPGLVVHGPLIATLLADLLRRELPGATLSAFEFRAVRPTYDLAPFAVHGLPAGQTRPGPGDSVKLWASDAQGWLTMQATATLGPTPG